MMLYKVTSLLLAFLLSGIAVGQRRSAPKANPSAPQSAVNPTFEGTLKLLTNKEIVIQLQSDQLLSIRRNRKTKFVENEKDIKPTDIAQGTPLAIDVKEDIDLKPLALRVVVNPPPPKK
jgi:hypothetical protein